MKVNKYIYSKETGKTVELLAIGECNFDEDEWDGIMTMPLWASKLDDPEKRYEMNYKGQLVKRRNSQLNMSAKRVMNTKDPKPKIRKKENASLKWTGNKLPANFTQQDSPIEVEQIMTRVDLDTLDI